MEISMPIEQLLELLPAVLNGHNDHRDRLRAFLEKYAQRPFYPHPNRLRPMKLGNAIRRCADLKADVRERLIREVNLLWAAFDSDQPLFSDRNREVETDGRSSAGQAPDPPPMIPAAKTAAATRPEIAAGVQPRHDWFDRLLTAVAGCIGLFRA